MGAAQRPAARSADHLHGRGLHRAAGTFAIFWPGLPRCACRKSNTHVQMMKSVKKWRRQKCDQLHVLFAAHAIRLSPLFPQIAKRPIVPPWECHTGSTSHLWISTTRARLAGTWVDNLLTGRAWLRRAAWSVEREPGGLVPTTVTRPPPIPFRAGTFSRRVSCCEARLRCLSTERHCRRSCA